MPTMSRALVYYCTDPALVRTFYGCLGLEFVQEKHGDGPVHYACEFGDASVLELYPRGKRRKTDPAALDDRQRLMLTVTDFDAVLAALQAMEARLSPVKTYDQEQGLRSVLTVDPDGRQVMILEGVEPPPTVH